MLIPLAAIIASRRLRATSVYAPTAKIPITSRIKDAYFVPERLKHQLRSLTAHNFIYHWLLFSEALGASIAGALLIVFGFCGLRISRMFLARLNPRWSLKYGIKDRHVGLT
jgi:hypothetical protein